MKQVDPQVLTKKWTETIRAEKEKEWVPYAKSPDGLLFYYSPASLSVVDKRYVRFRDQVRYPAEWTKDLSYVWRSVKVNCTDKMFKFSYFVALDKAGNTTNPGVSETAWASLPEESPLGTFAFNDLSRKGQVTKKDGTAAVFRHRYETSSRTRTVRKKVNPADSLH